MYSMKRTSANPNRQWQWAVLAIVLLAFLVLFPPYDWSFVGDDFVQFRYVWKYMSRPFTAIALLNPYTLAWYYRPLQNWWFLANRLVFGFNPFPYYAILATFHALAICLVYRTSRQLRLSSMAAFCAAALFAIHAHWVDVVAWLSSVAIVLATIFNLAAVSTYLIYLKKLKKTGDQILERESFNLHSLISHPHYWLGLTTLFFLFALTTHEEAFLLPALLLVIRQLTPGEWKWHKKIEGQAAPELSPRLSKEGSNHSHHLPRFTLYETTIFVGMFLISIVYLYIQFMRPNLTLEANQIGLSGYLLHVNIAEIGRFLVDGLAHFTLAFNLLNLTGGYIAAFSLAIAALLLLSYLYGGRVVQIGLTWMALHLIFIYFALWTQKPELFAGRHIYQAGLGLVWSIGALVDKWQKRWAMDKKSETKRGKRREKREKRQISSFPSSHSFARLLFYFLPLLLLAAVYLYQLPIINNTQRSWLERAERYRQAEMQVKEIVPTVDANTTVFANRFPITPSFLPATFQVWYETTINTTLGGGIPQLQAAGRATQAYYLFDYQDGNVVNLMPELQAHEETLFLWAQNGQLEQITPSHQINQLPDANLSPVVAGPENDLRVSIVPTSTETADIWNSIIYPISIPTNSQLQFSLFAQDTETTFRIRIGSDGSEEELLSATSLPTLKQWADFTIPLRDYWGQSVEIRLESTKDGFWGNPRLVIDP